MLMTFCYYVVKWYTSDGAQNPRPNDFADSHNCHHNHGPTLMQYVNNENNNTNDYDHKGYHNLPVTTNYGCIFDHS